MNIHTPSNSVLVKALALGTLTTAASASVDTRGYVSAQIVTIITTAGGATFDAQVEDAPDNSTWADVAGALLTQVPASQTRQVNLIDINLKKTDRYLRVDYTVAGTVTGAILVNLFSPVKAPVAQDQTPVQV